MNILNPDSQEPRQAASANALPPTPPTGPHGEHEQVAPRTEETRQRLLAAAAPGMPPRPPEAPRDEERDPNRMYGYITTPGDPPRVQKYSYIGEEERQRKSAFLRANPAYEYPPGDPMKAPQDAMFASVTFMSATGLVTATYWYRTDEERKIARELVAGKL